MTQSGVFLLAWHPRNAPLYSYHSAEAGQRAGKVLYPLPDLGHTAS